MKPHKNATLALKALHIADTKKSKFNAGRRSKWTNRAFILEFEHFKPPKSKDKLESDILCIVKVGKLTFEEAFIPVFMFAMPVRQDGPSFSDIFLNF